MIDDEYSNAKASFLKAVSGKKFDEIERLFPRVSKEVRFQYITGDKLHPLHYASSPETVQFFISTGVDINVKNSETDETPLLTAIKLSKSPAVVRELLNAGAFIEVRNKYTLNTPLNQAVLITECPLETIQALLECGAAVNTANKYCNTPLHNACQGFRGDLKIIELLLKFGSAVNFRNLSGDTPLNIALQNPHFTEELVKKLLIFNAKVTAKVLQDAVLIQHDNYLNIITGFMQHNCVANFHQWLDILKQLLKNVKNEQKVMNIGRLIIKYSFLSNESNHPVQTNMKFRKCGSNNISFLKSFRKVIIPEFIYKKKHSLALMSKNLESFLNDCSAEIRCMKRDKLENNISVYNFIVSNTDKVNLDNKIIKILKEDTYPIYSDIILNKVKRAALIDKLILQQVYTVVQHGDATEMIILDALPVCIIAKYLNVDEIKNFLDAFCNASKDEGYFWDNIREIDAHLSKRLQIHRTDAKKRLLSLTGCSSTKILKKNSPRI